MTIRIFSYQDEPVQIIRIDSGGNALCILQNGSRRWIPMSDLASKEVEA